MVKNRQKFVILKKNLCNVLILSNYKITNGFVIGCNFWVMYLIMSNYKF